MSLPSVIPHSGQTNFLSLSFKLSLYVPQLVHNLVVGNHLSIIWQFCLVRNLALTLPKTECCTDFPFLIFHCCNCSSWNITSSNEERYATILLVKSVF